PHPLPYTTLFRSACIGPIESIPSRTLLQLLRTEQRGQSARDTVHRACRTLLFAFGRFELFPTALTIVGGVIAEHMRMPRFHLVGDRACNVFERKVSSFFGDPRMKDDLEQQVAELATQLVDITARNGIGHLVSFLDGVRSDRLKRLCNIPFATELWVAKARHDREEAF